MVQLQWPQRICGQRGATGGRWRGGELFATEVVGEVGGKEGLYRAQPQVRFSRMSLSPATASFCDPIRAHPAILPASASSAVVFGVSGHHDGGAERRYYPARSPPLRSSLYLSDYLYSKKRAHGRPDMRAIL